MMIKRRSNFVETIASTFLITSVITNAWLTPSTSTLNGLKTHTPNFCKDKSLFVVQMTKHDDDSTSSLQLEDDINNTQSSLENIKSSIFKTALLSGRGVWSRPCEATNSYALISQLESYQQDSLQGDNASSSTTSISTPRAPQLKDGFWELVLSDIDPFRASVFFLALASAVEQNLMKDASDNALKVHSMATGGGEVGRVAHVIQKNGTELHSLVELRSGSLPSLPLSLSGTVISSGELTPRNEGKDTSFFDLKLCNTTVQGSNVNYGLPSEGGLKPGVNTNLLSFIGDQFVPSGDIFSFILDPIASSNTNPISDGKKQIKGNNAELQLTYADDDMMVWRIPQLDHFFCFVKGDRQMWPAFDEMEKRLKDSSTTDKRPPSLIGSAFALGMLNPFFSRRAGK